MFVPFHASTKTRLHETYHAHHTSPRDMETFIGEVADEFRARAYPYRMMGKKGKVRAGDIMYVFVSLVEIEGIYPVTAAAMVFQALKEAGMPLSKETRSALWWNARAMCGTGFPGELSQFWVRVLSSGAVEGG